MKRTAALLAALVIIAGTTSFTDSVPRVFAQQPAAQVGPIDADIVDAVYLEVDPSMTHRLGMRFRAQMLFGTNVISEFEVMRGARIFRDGQPARLLDLRTGDRVRFQLASSGEPFVTRLVAFSR